MVRNLSWIDREHLRALVADTAWTPEPVVPRRDRDTRSEATPLVETDRRRRFSALSVHPRTEPIEPAPSRRPEPDAVRAVPERARPTASTSPTPSSTDLGRGGSLKRASAPVRMARSAPVVRLGEASPVATAEALDEVPPPPDYLHTTEPLPEEEATFRLDPSESAPPPIAPFHPPADATLEEQIDRFIDWALDASGLHGAFVADHEGLMVAERRRGDVDVALASVVEQMFEQLEPFLGGQVEGHIALRNVERYIVITWSKTEYGRFYAGLTGTEAPEPRSLPAMAEAFGNLFPR